MVATRNANRMKSIIYFPLHKRLHETPQDSKDVIIIYPFNSIVNNNATSHIIFFFIFSFEGMFRCVVTYFCRNSHHNFRYILYYYTIISNLLHSACIRFKYQHQAIGFVEKKLVDAVYLQYNIYEHFRYKGESIVNIRRQLESYVPYNLQENSDIKMILYALDHMDDLFSRNNPFAHFTASAWIVNPERTHVLMAWHNIYNAWAWTGGHADGETDLLKVAIKEAREETGIEEILPVTDDIYSVEVLTVAPHIKRGKYVSSHLHLNVTYLLTADDSQSIHCKPDENSAVAWRTLEEAGLSVDEPIMQPIYTKLNEKLSNIQ